MDDYDKTFYQLPVQAQNEINVVFKIYPEIAEGYGINSRDIQPNPSNLIPAMPAMPALASISTGMIAKSRDSQTVISKVKYALTDFISSLLWVPVGAGERLGALDISEQEKTFQTDEGEIRITCVWEGQIKEHAAYIWLKWEADIKPDTEFVIQFLNPATKEVRYEFRPKNFMAGRKTIKKKYLKFDPTKDKWGIYIGVER